MKASAAMSCASCTEALASMAKPVGRARIDVGVVAEDRERVPGDRARGHVEDARLQLAGDLEHLREHQQQALDWP